MATAQDNATTATAKLDDQLKVTPKALGNYADGFRAGTGQAVILGTVHTVNRKRKLQKASISCLKSLLKSATDKQTGLVNADAFRSVLHEVMGDLARVDLGTRAGENGKNDTGIILNGAADASQPAAMQALQDSIDQVL